MNGTVDTGLVYRMWYRTALEQLGEQGAELAADYLEDREFGVDAAVVMEAHLSCRGRVNARTGPLGPGRRPEPDD
jgi:broad specificity phosphatase PhoE